jgi:hypothetical protein
MLDYGAGKGRLLSSLSEIAKDQGKNLAEFVSYFAFDFSQDDKQYCLDCIKSAYNDKSARHFLTDEEFFSAKGDASIDLVVMCNVLHEIPPSEWLDDCVNSLTTGEPRNPPPPLKQLRPQTKAEEESDRKAREWIENAVRRVNFGSP